MGRQPSYSFMVKKLKQIWERKARWKPEFSPKNERIGSVVAWVRLPDLPAPLFDKKFLLNLGNSIGKAIRLDVHTAQRARGKFARIKCGWFGHNRDGCEAFHRRKAEEGMEVEVERQEERMMDGVVKQGAKEIRKIVQRTRRQRRPVMPEHMTHTGSRFSVLHDEAGQPGVVQRKGGRYVWKGKLTPRRGYGGVDMDTGEPKVMDAKASPIDSMGSSMAEVYRTPALAD
ncbi:hypothetical protein K1719_016563 [Acacia pycnantha]|nr:hypothetical protein K1719_016563 [Acacia pycnantha]